MLWIALFKSWQVWFCLNHGDIVWFLCHMHKTMSYGVSSEGILGLFSSFLKVLAHTDMTYFFSLSGRGTNVAEVQHMFRVPSKWCEVAELKFPVCQQLVIPLFWGPYHHLLPFSFVFLITGCHQLFKSYFQYFERSRSIFLQLSKICCRHTTFLSLPFSRYAKITNGIRHS